MIPWVTSDRERYKPHPLVAELHGLVQTRAWNRATQQLDLSSRQPYCPNHRRLRVLERIADPERVRMRSDSWLSGAIWERACE